jgi:hypothetical protein
MILGGIEIPPSSVHPCTDDSVLGRIIDESVRPSIKEVDLGAIGITHLDPIQPRGFGRPPGPAPEELFLNYRAGILARWPNKGYAKIGKVTEPGNGENDQDKPKRQPVFEAGDRAKRWSQAKDLWLYGYWAFDWADESIPVTNVNRTTGTVTLKTPHVFGVASGSPFFAENLIEELDRPSEYFIDRKALKLYFLDRAEKTPASSYQLSTLSAPLVSISDASNITVRGLDFCISRGDAASFKNCESVRFEGCTFTSLGGRVAVIDGGHRSGLQSCNIAHTGEGGVSLSGGDRNTLSPGLNFVANCDFSDFERRSQTYRPAVWINGVGNRVSHCAMHDAPHSAIIYGGNNHVIEYNEFYRTIAVTGDGGVVYTGRDWSARGTVIQYNYFHDNIGQKKWEPAIYVDDLGSGIKMIGNLIERCHWGFLIGGGRENILDRNVLVDCDLAFDCDARGLGWAARSKPTMLANLNAVPYQSEIWRTNYPELPNILNEDPMAPARNVIRGNLLVRSGKVDQQMEAPFRKNVTMTGNVETKSDAELSKFLPVPRSKMGLIRDRLRASLPPDFAK